MSDLFDLYKIGVACLLEAIGKAHPDYDTVLAQRHRLVENIEKVELHRDNETLKSERSEILYNLDKLALRLLGKPFHELYEQTESQSPNKSSSQEASRQKQEQDYTLRPVQIPPSDEYAYEKRIPPNIRVNQSNKRDIISNIEYILDTTERLDLTGDSIKYIVTRITDVHIWLRSSEADLQTFKAGKSAVLIYIRDSIINLNIAVKEYSKRGQTAKFFKDIETGRQALESTLRAW